MGIEFDDNQAQQLYAQIQQNNEATGIAKFLLDKGIAKDEQAASQIMVGIMVLAFGLTGFVIFKFIL